MRLALILIGCIMIAGCAGMPASQRILVDRMIETAKVLESDAIQADSGGEYLDIQQQEIIIELLHEHAKTARQLEAYIESENNGDATETDD